MLNTLGDGFVEAVDDSTLIAIASRQPGQSHGLIRDEAIQVPILEARGQTRVGRFGWKDQHGSLLSVAADAYVNEMGVTSRLRMVDSTSVCKVTSDPEDRRMHWDWPISTTSRSSSAAARCLPRHASGDYAGCDGGAKGL